MQGETGRTGSLPETLEINHGSAPSNAPTDQQLRWNDMLNPAGDQIRDYILSPGDMNAACLNSVNHERQMSTGWSLGGPSSSNTQSEVGSVEQNAELGSENQWISPAGGSDQRGCGHLIEDNNGRAGCSREGCHLSCKIKAMEANIGQSPVSGSSSYLEHTDNNARSAVPAPYNLSRNLGVPAPLEQVNPRLILGATEVTSANIPDLCDAGSSPRNACSRINPQNQLDSIPPTLFSTEGAVGHSSFSSSQLSEGQLPGDYSLNLRSASTADNMIPQSQPVLIHGPASPRNVQAHRWNGGSGSGAGSSADPIFSPTLDLDDVGDLIRRLAHRRLTIDHVSLSGDLVIFTAWYSDRSGVLQSASPTVLPIDPLYPTTKLVLPIDPLCPTKLSPPRPLFSSARSDCGGQSTNHSPLRSGHGSTQEMGFSSVPGNPQAHPGSALWTERQGDSGLGSPHLLQPSSAAGGESDKILSEIRNALGLMRRGESLRSEDVKNLEQSVYFGVADFLRRQGDVQLDIDDMSCEELLILEYRIQNLRDWMREETVISHLKRLKCSTIIGSPLEAQSCYLCLEEYNERDNLGTLKCGHGFHPDCIRSWLLCKNSCPICKRPIVSK